MSFLIRIAGRLWHSLDAKRRERRWAHLRNMGMKIGGDVWLPDSTTIDDSHCYLISIGDHCGFGEGVVILAHDAQMDEFIDAARIGRVLIHESCHIGARAIILPDVEIGPRTIVGAGSVVTRSLPPNTVCAGNPARVICTLDEYLEKHRARLLRSTQFEYVRYDIGVLTPARLREVVAACESGSAYIVGGRSAELRGKGGTPRTPAGSHERSDPVRDPQRQSVPDGPSTNTPHRRPLTTRP
jgi:maltose O-acetyltransferase